MFVLHLALLAYDASPAAHGAAPTAVQQWDAGVSWTTGYVPVAKGSIFYAFVPHADPRAPLALWMQGGPGASGIEDGMLLINGPLALGADGALIRREVSWSTEFAMLYVDQPVGTGYSFAAGNESDVASYAASSYPEASNMVVELLDAVYDELKLWSRASPLLLTGESYAGHYCPAVAASILDANAARPAARRFNLQGVAIGDGLTDPPTQVRTKPAAALAFGLIGTSEHARCAAHAEAAAEAAAAGDFAAALRSRDAMEDIVAASGVNLYDVRMYGDYADGAVATWLSRADTRARLGVPPTRAFGTHPNVAAALTSDVMRSYTALVKRALSALPRGVLLYQGQFDWKDGASSNEAWLAALDAPEVRRYLNASRVPLSTAALAEPYGWVKGAGKLHDAILRGAGHMAPRDQPVAALDLLRRWAAGVL